MNQSPDLKTQRRLAVLFSLPFALSLLFFGLTVFSDSNDLQLQKVQALSLGLSRLRSLSSDIEIGEHGFVLTGDESYLVPLEQANENLRGQVRACHDLAAASATGIEPQIAAAASLIEAQGKKASAALAIFHRSGAAPALAAINQERDAAGAAKRAREALENLEDTMANRERAVLRLRRRWNHASYFLFALGTASMVFVLMRLYQAATSYLHSRDRLAAELQSLNAQLESQVASRTHDLTAANEELQQFAYVASHDLQEPLRTVTSFTQLLQARYRGKFDEDADEFMEHIVSASRRMTDLINGLLALVRLRKEGQAAVPISFSDLVQEVRSSLAASIAENGAEITDEGLPNLVVNRVQLLQLLQNLISNSIKYRRPEVAPRIHVTATREGTHWVFNVQDNGRGFDQQFAERIFGLFQRLSGGVDGTGIGLSIARKIVERHGGRIWAKSVEGSGSTFSFSLPTSLEVAQSAAAKPTNAMARAT